MRTSQLIFIALWSLVAAQTTSMLRPDPPITCDSCGEWNVKREPFRIFGNTYYVGPTGLSAVLIASDRGLILLDGGLPQSAALIDENIRALGFQTSDIRLIVNSHGHFDHAGGIAALQRASGAVVAASPSTARALERGQPVDDDPQFGFGPKENGFPPMKTVRVIADGETLRVGDQAITAHFTPGHTPGSTTWTWRSCEGSRCLDVVYADSLTAVSAPGFRFTGDAAHPGIVDAFRRSMATVERLPCDVLLTVHPGFADLDKKLERRRQGASTNPFIGAQECRAYAATAARTLDRRIADEKSAKP